MSDEIVEFIDGESATDVEVDDGVTLGAPSIRAALEALLMVTEEPMSTSTLATLTRTPEDLVVTVLHDLAQEYAVQERGFDLRELGHRGHAEEGAGQLSPVGALVRRRADRVFADQRRLGPDHRQWPRPDSPVDARCHCSACPAL